MNSRLNVGVIGLGRLGRVYATDLTHRVRNARLVAVADKQEHLAESFAGEYGVPKWYKSPQVRIETWSWMPQETERPFFCEKPISISLEEAGEMYPASKRR